MYEYVSHMNHYELLQTLPALVISAVQKGL
jgi:hypothetical protein